MTWILDRVNVGTLPWIHVCHSAGARQSARVRDLYGSTAEAKGTNV
jgi:hypothetical protein